MVYDDYTKKEIGCVGCSVNVPSQLFVGVSGSFVVKLRYLRSSMHELLKHVLTERDLTRAGDIFAIPDSDIVDDLNEIVSRETCLSSIDITFIYTSITFPFFKICSPYEIFRIQLYCINLNNLSIITYFHYKLISTQQLNSLCIK